MKLTGLALILAAAIGAQAGCASTQARRKPYTTVEFDVGAAERTPELETNLMVIAAAKNFAVHKLGLAESQNYMRFRSFDDSRTLYWLHITGKYELPDSLDNFTRLDDPDEQHRELHEEPIVLTSLVDTLADEESYYAADGKDILRRIMKDFNDGDGCDLRPTFFDRPVHRQVNSVFHEDFHNSLDVWGVEGVSKDLEESLAMFIGYAGAVEFTAWYFGEGSRQHADAVLSFDNYLERSYLITAAYDELELVYAQPFNDGVRDAMKQYAIDTLNRHKQLFSGAFLGIDAPDFTFNNAMIWKERAYTKHAASISRAYEKAGSMSGLLAVLKTVPLDDEPRAIAYLNDYADRKYAKK